jgi:hypothetical protein
MGVSSSQFNAKKEGVMFRKSSLIALSVAVALWASPTGSANASAIDGVWDCQVVRPGNLAERPLLYTFHEDGTTTYSSQTNISNVGFTSRAGGFGQYQKINRTDFRATFVENMYKNGNAGGRFLVDIVLHFDKIADRLCSGDLLGDPCPTNGHARATKFQFSDGSACILDTPLSLADPICGEVDLNPGNGVNNVIVRCDRINKLSTYGSSVPVFPMPDPLP